MAELHVEIVAVERELWSGDATFVFTRTTAGEIGILPRHIPLVAQLVDDAMVRVEREGEDDLRIAVDGGFLSVTEEAVRILVENAELESEINADEAKQDSESDDERTAAWGRARLRALGADRLIVRPMSASMMFMVALIGVLLVVVVALTYRLWKLVRSAGPPPSCVTYLRSADTAGGTGWSATAVARPVSTDCRACDGGRTGDCPGEASKSCRAQGSPWRRVRHHDRRDRRPRITRRGTRRRRDYEIALDRGALTAFTSWLESRPSPRARRRTY